MKSISKQAISRSTLTIVAAVTTVLVLAGGGVAWAATSGSDEELSGDRFDRASTAALEEVGSGKVAGAETSDDPGEAYEVEVIRADGTEVEVTLDEGFRVLRTETDQDGESGAQSVVTDAERQSAEQAALVSIGDGRVTEVDAGDDAGEAYEVEVTAADGARWEVTLAADFTVLNKKRDD